MNDITRDAIVSVAAFAAIFGIAYIFLMTRYRERMTMLERGIDKSPFQSQSQTLKFGMLCMGIAVGILMGTVLKYYGLEKTTSYLSMVFLFGGISLILSYIIAKNDHK